MLTPEQERILINALDSHHKQNIDDINIDIHGNELLEIFQLDDYQEKLDAYIEIMKNEIDNVRALEHTNCKRDIGLRFDVIPNIIDKLDDEYWNWDVDPQCDPNKIELILKEVITKTGDHFMALCTELAELYNASEYCLQCVKSKELFSLMRDGTHHTIN